MEQLAVVKAQITEDIDFVCSCELPHFSSHSLISGLPRNTQRNRILRYSEKQAEKKVLAWDVEELQRFDQNF